MKPCLKPNHAPNSTTDTNNLYISLFSATEQQRDKRINRDDEYSDSEDEGDEPPLKPTNRRKNEHSYRDTKRPRLMEEINAKNGAMTGGSSNQAAKPPAVSTGGGALSSPLPPEPSPITPLPQEDGASNKNKSERKKSTYFQKSVIL